MYTQPLAASMTKEPTTLSNNVGPPMNLAVGNGTVAAVLEELCPAS